MPVTLKDLIDMGHTQVFSPGRRKDWVAAGGPAQRHKARCRATMSSKKS